MRTEKASLISLTLKHKLPKCHEGGQVRNILRGENKVQICDIKIWSSISLSRPFLQLENLVVDFSSTKLCSATIYTLLIMSKPPPPLPKQERRTGSP